MSISTFLAALVASGTALWVAYKVYPHQKELDRQLELRSEKRSAIVDYFDALHDFIDSCNKPNRDDMDKTRSRLEASFRLVSLFCSGSESDGISDSHQAATKFAKTIKGWADAKERGDKEKRAEYHNERKKMWREFHKAWEKVLNETRVEFLPNDQKNLNKLLKEFSMALIKKEPEDKSSAQA